MCSSEKGNILSKSLDPKFLHNTYTVYHMVKNLPDWYPKHERKHWQIEH